MNRSFILLSSTFILTMSHLHAQGGFNIDTATNEEIKRKIQKVEKKLEIAEFNKKETLITSYKKELLILNHKIQSDEMWNSIYPGEKSEYSEAREAKAGQKNEDPFIKPLDIKDRPPEVIEEIHKAYEKVCYSNNETLWNFHGSDKYFIFEDDHFVAKKIIISAPPEQTDFYFMDIGAGNFSWGKHLSKFINSTDFKRKIHAHIIGVRGEYYFSPEVKTSGVCTLYELGGFKVEDISEIFGSKFPTFKGRLDMVVSSYTLRHLVDPVGTFIQTYDMLRPGTGLAFMEGFYVDCKSKCKYSIMLDILKKTHAPYLLRDSTGTRGGKGSFSLPFFVIKRSNDKPCSLSMRYNGLTNLGNGVISANHSQNAIKFLIPNNIETENVKVWKTVTLSSDTYNGKASVDVTGDPSLLKWFQDLTDNTVNDE